MGVSVEQWRAAVGCWRSGARRESTSQGWSWRLAGSVRDEALARQRFWVVVLAALLVIGGVELNPGPPVGKRDRNPQAGDQAKDMMMLREENKDLQLNSKRLRTELEKKELLHKENVQILNLEIEELKSKIMQQKQQLEEVQTKEFERSGSTLYIEPRASTELWRHSARLSEPPDPSSSLITYKTTSSKADGAGLDFEIKMLALVFLRAINKNYEFFLASNLEEAGAFDDIVLKHRINEHADWSTTFIQLKHKQSDFVTRSKLLSLGKNKNDFSLIKYCKSYSQIKADCTSKDDLLFLGNFDKYEFVIFTNAEAGKEIEKSEHKDREYGLDMSDMLSTSEEGHVILMNGTTNVAVLEGLKEIVSFKELLIDLNGSDQSKTSEIAKKLTWSNVTENKELFAKCEQLKKNIDSQNEVHKSLHDMDNVVDIGLYQKFIEKLLIFTGQASEKELDKVIKNEIETACRTSSESEVESILRKIVEEVKLWWQKPTAYLTQDSTIWKNIIFDRLDNFSHDKYQEFQVLRDIVFDDKSIDIIKNVVRGTRILNVETNGTLTRLTCLKVYQALSSSDDQHCIVIGIQQLRQRSEQILAAWQNKWCRTLIIECDTLLGNDCAKQLATSLQRIVNFSDDIKVVLITSGSNDLAEHLKRDMINYDEHLDNCRWADMKVDSQTSLLNRMVTFQGHKVSLSSIVDQEKRLMKQLLRGDTLHQLVTDKLSFGMTLNTDVKYYIPRKLNRNNRITKIDSNKDIKGRTVLLIAEPGMGKTTLTTHVAIRAKELDPTRWIVRINLNDCSNYLDRLKDSMIDLEATIEFMMKFGLPAENHCVLEKVLFEHCLRSSGRMLVFIDAVDEVCPDYEDTVLSLIEHLIESTKIQSLWVTSRISEKDKLEKTMNDRAFSLESFIKKDQYEFLNKFWKTRISGLDLNEQQLNEFTDQVLQLAEEAFQGENLVIGIPQQTMMLGEYFEEQLMNWKEKDLCNLSERLNLLTLYNHFVHKKYAYYTTDKKRENVSNVSVRNDNAEHFEKFITNHKHAALILLLSSSELRALAVSGDAQIEAFLKSIEEGREKTGIIVHIVDEKPSFIHRTFAEYFAALWFADHFITARTFLENKLFTSEFTVIKEIFDLQLSAENHLNTSVLSRITATFNSLLSSGVDVNSTDAGGRTALHLASSYKHPNMKHIVEELLSHGARVNIQDYVMQWRPLQYADRASSWTIAGLLLRNGADINDLVETKSIITSEVFSLLIAFISNDNKNYKSLMFSAAYHGELDVVKYLVTEHNVDVNFHDNAGVTLMHKAAEGGRTELMRYLESEGVSYTVTDNLNASPILYATTQGHHETMTFLGLQKASIELSHVKDLTEEQRSISLILAASQSNVKLAKALLDNKASVNYSDVKGTTPLHWAASKNDLDMVKLLLKKDAHVNVQDIEGRTALVRSIEEKTSTERTTRSREANNRLKLVKLLVTKGAHFVGLPNGITRDVSMYAMQNGHRDIAAYLSRELNDINNKLLTSILGNNSEDIKHFIDRGASLRIVSAHTRVSYFMLAAEYGTVVDLEDSFETINNIDTRNGNGETPLMFAVNTQSIEKVEWLVKKGADVKATNEQGNTSLHFAVDSGIMATVKFLVCSHADIDARNDHSISPLRVAANKGFLEIAKYLIENGSDVNGKKNDECTPLQVASLAGKLDVVELLVSNNAMIDAIGIRDRTPLLLAVEGCHFEVVEFLLNNNADMEAIDGATFSSLHIATIMNSIQMVKLLLHRGLYVDSKINSGVTSLMIAARNNFIELISILLAGGANIDAVNDIDSNALDIAVVSGSLEAVQCLIEKSTNMNAIDSTYVAILHIAAASGNLNILEYIVQKNYSLIDVDTPENGTALMIAIQNNTSDCIKYLIEQGASIDKIDGEGSNALHHAAISGNLQLVRCLLERKAPLDLKNKHGETPLDLAIKYGHNDMVKYINIVTKLNKH